MEELKSLNKIIKKVIKNSNGYPNISFDQSTYLYEKEIKRIIYEVDTFQVNWSVDTLITGKQKLEEHLKIKFAFLDKDSIDLLCNYFSYNWR